MTQYDDDLLEIRQRARAATERGMVAFRERMAYLRSELPEPVKQPPKPLIDVGWSVWSHERLLPASRLYPDGEARGGIVTQIATKRDVETGEVTRAFRCLDPYKLPSLEWSFLAEPGVDPDRTERPETTRLWKAIVALADDVARPGKKLDLIRTAKTRGISLETAFRLWRALP